MEMEQRDGKKHKEQAVVLRVSSLLLSSSKPFQLLFTRKITFSPKKTQISFKDKLQSIPTSPQT